MRVNSDAADELHVHSNPEHTLRRRAEARSVVPVHRRRAGQGRRRTARAEPDDRHHPGAVTDQLLLAHGLGGSNDLPIPYTYALIGAAWALTFTFAVVVLAWKKPRFDPRQAGRAAAAVGDPGRRRAGHPLGGGRWWGCCSPAGWRSPRSLGPQNGDNALPGVFYVLLWVGLVALSLADRSGVAGAVAGAHGLPAAAGGRSPAPQATRPRWGTGPPRSGLFAFVWLELASPDPGSLAAVKIWLLRLPGGDARRRAGVRDPVVRAADPFEVYGVVASRLSPLRRNPDGRIAIGNPFDHLPSMPVRPGHRRGARRCCWARRRSTASRRCRSGATSSTTWRASVAARRAGAHRRAAAVRRGRGRRRSGWRRAHRRRRRRQRRRELPGLMAHSLIPIVIGYVFAHYLTYLVERGQQTVLRLPTRSAGAGWPRSAVRAVDAPGGAGDAEGLLRGRRAHRRRDRRARPGAGGCCPSGTR